MDFVKAGEILKVLEKLDSDSEKSIIGALNLAEHVERSSKEFYEKEADKTKGTELEPFFKFLVKEEVMHLNKILELKKNIEDKKAKKISFEQNAAPHIHAIPAGQNEMTAILYALWREKKAAEFYSEAASKTKGAVKKFFEELAEFEKGHVKLIESFVETEQNAGELIMG
jgi:rubrerythrin